MDGERAGAGLEKEEDLRGGGPKLELNPRCVPVRSLCCRLMDWVREPRCGEKRGNSASSTYSPSESSLSLAAREWSTVATGEADAGPRVAVLSSSAPLEGMGRGRPANCG